MLINSFNSLLIAGANLMEEPAYKDFVDIIWKILWPILAICAAAGTIYAVVLGVNMAKADSADKREEAKQRIIYTLIGVLVVVVLIVVFWLVSNNIESIVNLFNPTDETITQTTSAIGLLR